MLDMRDSHGASRWTNAYMFVRFCKGKLWIVAPIDVNEQPDQGSEFTVWSFCDCSTKSCSHLFTHTHTHTALYCVLEGRCRDRNLPTQPASPPQLQYKMSKFRLIVDLTLCLHAELSLIKWFQQNWHRLQQSCIRELLIESVSVLRAGWKLGRSPADISFPQIYLAVGYL